MANTLGKFSFIKLDGPLEGLRPDLMRTTRPGTAGVTYWNTGIRGRSFPLTSTVDETSTQTALVTLRDYELLIADGLQRLVIENIFYGTVKVEDVRERERFAISSAGGGLLANPGALLIADWTMTLIATAD